MFIYLIDYRAKAAYSDPSAIFKVLIASNLVLSINFSKSFTSIPNIYFNYIVSLNIYSFYKKDFSIISLIDYEFA